MSSPPPLRLVIRPEGGRLIAFVVSGSTILDVEPVESVEAAQAWFDTVSIAQPWEMRH